MSKDSKSTKKGQEKKKELCGTAAGPAVPTDAIKKVKKGGAGKTKPKKDSVLMVSFDRQTLEDVLAVVKDFIVKADTLPVLECVRIRSTGKTCRVEATNLELSWQRKLKCDGDKVDMCVPAEILYKEVKALEGKEAELILIDNTVSVNGRCEILTQNVKDFPVIPVIKNGKSVDIENLSAHFKRVGVASSKDDSRYHINGVHIDFVNNKIAATDGHRLHVEDINARSEEVCSFTIPNQVVKLAVKHMLAPRLTFDDNGRFVGELAGGVITGNVIEGNFPDYDAVFPKSLPVRVEFNANELLHILEGAVPLSDGEAVILRVNNDEIKVESKSAGLGEYSHPIWCKTEGKGKDELVISFKAAYMRDALKAFKTDEGKATLEIDGALTGSLFCSKAVIMPMRV